MKQKQSDQTKQSNLPLKMLFFSYFNKHESIQLMSDCHNAINDKITKLASLIEQNFDEICSIVQDDEQNQQKSKGKEGLRMMQVIEEEDYWATERSNNEGESITERNRNLLVKKFNSMIGLLEKSSDKFGEIMYMYKNEIKQIAKDLTKERQLNFKLMKEIQQKGSRQVKQTRSISANQMMLTKKPTSLSHKPSLKKHNPITKPLLSITRQPQQSQDEQARQPPKPFCQQCLVRQKQDLKKQKQQFQQKNKWRQLSTKITNLKNQLSRYEQQLIGNQAEITRLNEQLKKKNDDDTKLQSEEKRKIKTISTTLRGEKIVLQNQLHLLKKKLQQNSQYITNLQNDNRKLQMQKDNLQSTIKWHTNTIQDLRNNFSSGIKQQGQLLNKYNETRQENLLLVEQIANQQKYLEQFAQKLKTVQESFRQQISSFGSKVHELEDIIEQKNETIIKLKMGKHDFTESISNKNQSTMNKQLAISRENRCITKQSIASKRDTHLSGTIMSKTMKKDVLGGLSGYSNNENFEDNMIKVLNKKLAIKQCQIQKLKQDNLILKAQLQVYKEID